jgi:hypothetical protein
MSIHQAIYILSTNYAGSHFLLLQMAAHDKCMSIGEFHRFDPGFARHKQACHICETDEHCPIFKGIYGQPINKLHPILINNAETANPKIETLVDNSKKTVWAKKFLNLPGITQKYIHLIRDPRALTRRWMINYDTRKEKRKVRLLTARRCRRNAWNILTGSEANVYAWKWTYQNQLITDFLIKNNLDYKFVTYDELVLQPDTVLRDIMEWAGHDYQPDQKEYWKFTHHGSQKPHYMTPPKRGDSRFDLRWKDYLNSETIAEISEHPAVAKYLNSQKLLLSEYGLQRDDEHDNS